MNKLLIVGTVAFDAIETPFGQTDKILGGAATYISLSAGQFGVSSGIVSVVGGDFPKAYLDKLNAKGVNTEGVEIVEDGKTFFWKGLYHNDLNTRDTLITDLNVLADFNPVVPQKFIDIIDTAILELLTISPLRNVRDHVKQVLTSAIQQGGTTLRDFVGGDGKPGYFAQQLYVYGRAGEPCKRCGAPLRERRLGQRSSVYCVACQR